MPSKSIIGGCLCGKVRYEISGSLISADHCHCSMCRRQHGAAFSTYAEFNPDDLQWVSGERLVKIFEPSNKGGWGFCKSCGSTLFGTEEGRISSVTLGTVEGDPGIRPDAHIFVGSKAVWHDICDDLPQHDKRADDASED